jgi:hypothetical protein
MMFTSIVKRRILVVRKYIDSFAVSNRMERARNWIEPRYGELKGKTFTIIGVGFVDIDQRYPRNAAKNEMELHPILDMSF